MHLPWGMICFAGFQLYFPTFPSPLNTNSTIYQKKPHALRPCATNCHKILRTWCKNPLFCKTPNTLLQIQRAPTRARQSPSIPTVVATQSLTTKKTSSFALFQHKTAPHALRPCATNCHKILRTWCKNSIFLQNAQQLASNPTCANTGKATFIHSNCCCNAKSNNKKHLHLHSSNTKPHPRVRQNNNGFYTLNKRLQRNKAPLRVLFHINKKQYFFSCIVNCLYVYTHTMKQKPPLCKGRWHNML